MPIYEYKCQKCGHGFEYLHFAGEETPPQCPQCDAAEVKRELSCFSSGAGASDGGLGSLSSSGGHSCGSRGFS